MVSCIREKERQVHDMVVFDAVGVNYTNKGAHLMLRAMEEGVQRAPFPALVSVNMKLARHARRHAEHLPASMWLEGSRPGHADALVRGIGAHFPRWVKSRYRLVADRDVNVVLDSSGFLYGDSWGTRGMLRRIATAQLWREQAKRLILMPQAFGPFANSQACAHMATLIGLSSLVYARDAESFGFLQEVAPKADNLRKAPDFTNLVLPQSYPGMEKFRGWIGIVPNRKMVDKGSRDDYFAFLGRAIDRIRESGEQAFLLVHERNDQKMAEELAMRFPGSLPIHYRDDPAELKAAIGQCRFIVASRFHAIVSALSQGVPAVGTSWSHKYRHLYSDYGAEHLLATDLKDVQFIDELIGRLIDSAYRDALSRDLARHAEAQKGQSEAMWREIFSSVRPRDEER